MTSSIHGVSIPDTKLARAVTEFVRDTEPDLLFHHSSRVYYFGALAGQERGLKPDAELLYTGAMFHDVGLVPGHSTPDERFEVDGANAARGRSSKATASQRRTSTRSGRRSLCTRHPASRNTCIPSWPSSPRASEMDVLGLTYDRYEAEVRDAVVHAHPRTPHFKEDILQAFYDGIKHKPDTTFGNVKADVMADKDPNFRRGNFCSVIRASAWPV